MSFYLSQRDTEPARIHGYPKRRRQPRFPGLDAAAPAADALREARVQRGATQGGQTSSSSHAMQTTGLRGLDSGPSYADFFRADVSALASEVA